MRLPDTLLPLFRRYGPQVRAAVRVLLATALPGAAAVVELVDAVLDCVHAEDGRYRLDADALPAASADDLRRVEATLELLAGELQAVVARVAGMADTPRTARQALHAAWGADERACAALARLDELARRCDRLERQHRRLLQAQGCALEMTEELLPLLRWQAGLAGFATELHAAGVCESERLDLLARFHAGLAWLHRNDPARAEVVFAGLARRRPDSVAVAVALAAAQATGQALHRAGQTLTRAADLRPGDPALTDLRDRLTRLTRCAATLSGEATIVEGLRAGDVVDGWRLEARLGSGGWGQVFRASRAGQTQALKVLHPHLARNPGVVERFRQEILNLTRLGGHPNLVEMYDFGYDTRRGCWYFLTELVDGLSLEAYLARHGALAPRTAVRLFADVAGGLAHAHGRGVKHRDVKPGNVLLRRDGRPVLVDFGVSAVAADDPITGCTPLFAAPEQLRGQQADARSDVYALAGSLYYALCYADARRREPALFDPHRVPLELRALLTQALHNDPERRPRDAGEFRAALLGVDGTLDCFVEVPGRWYARPAVATAGRWEQVATSPTVVRFRAWERYRFHLDRTVTDAHLSGLQPLTRLYGLDGLCLGDCRHVTDEGVAELRAFPHLRWLSLSCCLGIGEPGISRLRSLRGLTELDLRSCDRLTDACLAHLRGLTHLESMCLGCCYRLTDAGLEHLAALPRLRALDLSSCRGITERGVERLRGVLPNCRVQW